MCQGQPATATPGEPIRPRAATRPWPWPPSLKWADLHVIPRQDLTGLYTPGHANSHGMVNIHQVNRFCRNTMHLSCQAMKVVAMDGSLAAVTCMNADVVVFCDELEGGGSCLRL
jgi:hypothetical protein